jgi:hypothetical protein
MLAKIRFFSWWQAWLLPLGSSLWLLWGGCSPDSSDLVEVQHEQVFAMRLPPWLEPSSALNSEAQFQYENRRRNLFLLVRYDSLDALKGRYPHYTLEDYYDFHLERLVEPLQDVTAPAPDSLTLGIYPAFDGILRGTFKKDDLTFRLRVIQGEFLLYQILIWMPVGKQQDHAALVEEMLRSFRPLGR